MRASREAQGGVVSVTVRAPRDGGSEKRGSEVEDGAPKANVDGAYLDGDSIKRLKL